MQTVSSTCYPTKLALSKATGEFSNKQLVVHDSLILIFVYYKIIHILSFFLLITETNFSVSI